MVLVGCSSAALEKPPEPVEDVSDSGGVRRSAERLKEASQRRVVNSGEAVLSVTRTDGTVAWTMEAESSRVGLEAEGASQGFLVGVKGTLNGDDGEAVNTFSANEGKADLDTQRFKLFDRVELRSLGQKTVLRADEVEWFEDKELYVARGNVTVTGETWTFGPTEVLYARKDLMTLTESPDGFNR